MTTLERVVKVFEEVFDCDAADVSTETVPEDVPKWDSVGHMTLVSGLEGEFGCPFEIDDIMEMSSVAKIVEILEAKNKKNSDAAV